MKKINFKIDEIMLVLIVAIIAVIVSIYEQNKDVNVIEAEKITAMILDDHEISFVNGGVVDEGKLKEVQSLDYKELKEELNAKKDFCIYMEDENGNIILAKSSEKLSKDSSACKEICRKVGEEDKIVYSKKPRELGKKSDNLNKD